MRRPPVLKLIDLIYAAACNPTQWPQFIELLSEAMGAAGADLAVCDIAKSATSFNAAAGIIGPDFQREYLRTFAASDPFFVRAKALGMLRAGTIGVGDNLVPQRELERTDFHHDFGKRHGYFGGLTAVLAATEVAAATISVCRRKDHPFGAAEVSLIQVLMPHLQRAIQVHERMAESGTRATDLGVALNGISTGALLVAADGIVLFVNDSARETLALRDGLTIERGELRAERPRDTASLRRLIKGSADTSTGTGAVAGGILLLERPSRRRPLQLVVSPLSSLQYFGNAYARAIVFLHDPDRVEEPDMPRLQRVYGFSRAEADVARYLLQDKSVRETGDHLGISMNTVRFHLKQLFAKTQTRRQSELVRLLSSTMQVRRR